MSGFYLSRIRLRRGAGVDALRSLLDPADPEAALGAHHRLLWSIFADGPDRRRDFLWRADGDGRFLALSRRPPAENALFEPHETKPFEPVLAPDDRLRFALRANATKDRAEVSRRSPEARRGAARRVDIVMDLLREVAPGERASARSDLAARAAEDWMARQGTAAGFAVERLSVEDYRVESLPRPRGPRGRLGVLDLAGAIRVKDPAVFLAKLAGGFGRARAFGCGLMLIRRG